MQDLHGSAEGSDFTGRSLGGQSDLRHLAVALIGKIHLARFTNKNGTPNKVEKLALCISA